MNSCRRATLCPPLPQGEGRGEGIQTSGFTQDMSHKVARQDAPHRRATLCPPLPQGEGRGEGIQTSGFTQDLSHKVAPQDVPHREAILCPPLLYALQGAQGEGRGEGVQAYGVLPDVGWGKRSAPQHDQRAVPPDLRWYRKGAVLGCAKSAYPNLPVPRDGDRLSLYPPLLYALQGAQGEGRGEGIQTSGLTRDLSNKVPSHVGCAVRTIVVWVSYPPSDGAHSAPHLRGMDVIVAGNTGVKH